nr:hypothetical protein [Rhizobium sp.]
DSAAVGSCTLVAMICMDEISYLFQRKNAGLAGMFHRREWRDSAYQRVIGRLSSHQLNMLFTMSFGNLRKYEQSLMHGVVVAEGERKCDMH